MNTVELSEIPYCDICESQGIKQLAKYDAQLIQGPWAYVCEEHFQQFGFGLGTGKGQKIIKTKTNDNL